MFDDTSTPLLLILALCAYGVVQVVRHWHQGRRRDAFLAGGLFLLSIVALGLAVFQIRMLGVGQWLLRLFGDVPSFLR